MSKFRVSILELEQRALSEVRKQPGCYNVQEIAINRVTTEHAANNWSLCVVAAGASDANTAHARRFTSKIFCAVTTIF